jgi:hypothetical protein
VGDSGCGGGSARHEWPRPAFAHAANLFASLLLAAAISLLPGCSHRSNQATITGSAADTLSNGLPRALLPKLAPWTQVWRYSIPSLVADSLKRNSSAPFKFDSGWAGVGPFVETIRSRALVEVLSPDSVHSLDFDAYLDFDKGPDGNILAEREPESRAVLADFRADSAWVVEFCGTTCFHDGSYWVDAERFVLTGATQTGEQADGPWCPFLDVYGLRSRSCTRWLAPAVNAFRFQRYVQAADSALAARLERAGFGRGADSTASSRAGFPSH